MFHDVHALFPKAGFLVMTMGFLGLPLPARPAWDGAGREEGLGLCKKSPGGPHGSSPRPRPKGSPLGLRNCQRALRDGPGSRGPRPCFPKPHKRRHHSVCPCDKLTHDVYNSGAQDFKMNEGDLRLRRSFIPEIEQRQLLFACDGGPPHPRFFLSCLVSAFHTSAPR